MHRPHGRGQTCRWHPCDADGPQCRRYIILIMKKGLPSQQEDGREHAQGSGPHRVRAASDARRWAFPPLEGAITRDDRRTGAGATSAAAAARRQGRLCRKSKALAFPPGGAAERACVHPSA